MNALVRRYFDAIERSDRAALEELFAEDVVQIEFPNRLVPDGAKRDRAALLEGFERGKKVLRSQRYEIHDTIESAGGERIAIETTWIGVLAVALGKKQPGDELRARFAVFLEMKDGKIVAQRNYDCFDPF